MGILCVNLNPFDKARVKSWLKSGKLEQFYAFCQKNGYDPEEIKGVLAKSSTPTTVSSPDPAKEENVQNIVQDQNTVISEYLNNIQRTKTVKQFSKDIIKYCIIDFDGKTPIMRMPSEINNQIAEYKIQLLNSIRDFLIQRGCNVPEVSGTNAKKSQSANIILSIFWNNKQNFEDNPNYQDIFNKYVILHTFDNTLSDVVPFIKIGKKNNPDMFVVGRYSWDGFGTETFTSWSTSEYADAETNSSEFFKLFLKNIPQIDSNGEITSKHLSFSSLLSLFAEFKTWHKNTWYPDSSMPIKLPSNTQEFEGLLKTYEQDSSILVSLHPVLASIQQILFAKQDAANPETGETSQEYIISDTIRNLVINACLKYEPAKYLDNEYDIKFGLRAADLTQRVAVAARILLVRDIRGQLATILSDKDIKKETLEDLRKSNLISLKSGTKKTYIIKSVSNLKQICKLFDVLFSIELDDNLDLNDSDIKEINKFWKHCFDFLTSKETNEGEIIKATEYDKFQKPYHAAFSALANLLVSSSDKYVKSTIKNAEGNNVPASQLPSYITKWADRASDLVSGSPFIQQNAHLIRQPFMQSISKVGDESLTLSTMTETEILHLWMSSHFCQRFTDAVKASKEVGNSVFIQPTCFADKSTSFSFPIPINVNFKYGELGNKYISVNKIISLIKEGKLDEIYSTIGEIYFGDALGKRIVQDFKDVFPEWEWSDEEDYVKDLKHIEEFIQRYNPNSIQFIQNRFVEKKKDFIENVHYTKSGINIGALMELMIYTSNINTKLLMETVYEQFKSSVLHGGKESLWNAVRKDPGVVAFYSNLISNTPYANDPKYKITKELVSLTVAESVFDEDAMEFQIITEKEKDVVPNAGVNLILQPYFFTHVIFGKTLNDYFFGSALAHPNKSGITSIDLKIDPETLIQDYIAVSANQWITQTKRESVGGATYHSYFPGIDGGIPTKIKCAIIEDETTQVNNITGDTNDKFEPNDGSGHCHPIISRSMNVSLLDNPVGETKKTTYGAITTAGTQNNEKWSENEITCARMRHLKSRVPLRAVFEKMSRCEVVKIPRIKVVPKNLFIDINNDLNYKQINSVTIEYGNVLIRFTDNTIIEMQARTLDDVFKAFGDCWCKSKEDGDLVYSEASLDALYEYTVKANLLDQVIAYVINKTACKVGAINVNPRERWTNNDDFDTFELDTSGGGPMMDADHELQDSEGTESTQMLLALAQNGTSLEETTSVFNDIATIISEETIEFERGIENDEAGIKLADKYVSKTLKRSREGYSTAKQKIDEYHAKKAAGEDAKFPIEISAVNTAVVSAVRSHVSSKIIKRKYGGIGAVNTPGHNTVMYHIVDGQPMLYEELREHPVYRACLAKGIDPFTTISIENDFIQKVTTGKPVDFEDTILIKNKPLTYTVHSIENENGEQMFFYTNGEDTIAISVEDPNFDLNLGIYTVPGQYIDMNGYITINEWSEPIIIDTIEKYFEFRHRDDLDVYDWTIMAHNLKGIDSLYTFNVDGVVKTYSINETLYNKAMYIIKHWDGDDKTIVKAVSDFNKHYNIPQDTGDDIWNIVTRYTGDLRLPTDPSAKKKKILQLLCKDLRKDLKNPSIYLFDGEKHSAELLNVETIPAQIIMGRTYARQFGLKKQDSIAKIHREGFWESRFQDRFYCPDNHELFEDNLADIVLFDGTGNRIFVKYDPLSQFVPSKVNHSRNIIENSEGVLYYNGAEFIEKGNIKVYSYKTITGSEEDLLVIRNLEDLQKLKDYGFNITQFHFTENNYTYLMPVRYDFESKTEHYLWKDGKRTTTVLTKDSINNPLTKALLPAMNDSERSSLQHLMQRKLKHISENFEKSLEFVGTRIPCQSMQSFMACKVICFTDVEKNEIYIPAKLAWIQGSD